ncbi:Taurine catabolism dioxygenase TauD, TfdA family [Sphingobium faniae]|nr:Taurine catabolism dioxygenase TauD, TfdA family [Sphingobium faniae]
MASSARLSIGWPAAEKTGWMPGDVDMAAITHHVTDAEREVLLELVDRWNNSGCAVTEMTRADFSDARIDGLLDSLLNTLKTGPGLLFLSGLPYDEAAYDVRTLYWGIGTHFGRAVSQNGQGEMIGEVKVRPDVVARRAYGHSGKLILHTDRIDMLSLFCVSKPRSGGANIFVSGLAIWDAVARERPDLLPMLERGFHQNRLTENALSGEESTPYRVPVFGREKGLRSVLFSGNAAIDHQRLFFADRLTAQEEEALIFLTEVRDRPEFQLCNTLSLGDAVFINNHEILHSREAFEDGEEPQEKRKLLRLWLQGEPVRPKPETMTVMHNPSGLQGIDPRPVAA